MSWLSYFFPRTILVTSSRYNRKIRLNEEQGKYKLLVNGSRQSGEYVRQLWDHAFKELGITNDLAINRILVLGVAGGTVIQELHELYPIAQITGVDIDRVMLDIGKKCFQLEVIPRLILVNADAKDFVKNAVKKKLRYDFIVTDLFIGRKIPEFIAEPAFLRRLRDLLKERGVVLINYLREPTYWEKSERLFQRLKTVFSEVRESQIQRNRFFCCLK